MEAAKSPTSRVLAAVAVLVVTGWAWALSNVGMPDAVWLANAALTIVLLVLLAVVLVGRVRRG